ncbi:hypothetical protein [Flaviaesturariibacter terrae]
MERLFDLRFVIGAFFTVAGLLLLVYGFAEGAAINRNCGALFVLFGIVMVALSYLRPHQDPNTEEAPGKSGH